MDGLIASSDVDEAEDNEPIVFTKFTKKKQFSILVLVNCMSASLKPTCMRQSEWWNSIQHQHTHKLLHSELNQIPKVMFVNWSINR